MDNKPATVHAGYLPGCVGRIVELHATYYAANAGFGVPFEAKVARELADFCLRFQPDRDGLWLAVADGRIEGSIAIDGLHADAEGGHLRWFILSDKLRGQGMGKRLLSCATGFADAKRYANTFLWTFAGLDAARHLSIKGKYPRLFALPDRWSSWWPMAVWKGMREIRQTRPSLIWSTYPISTAHLIGGALSRLSGLPWVADFRDPMLNRGYPTEPLQRRGWQWLEASVLQHASACVFTTASAAQTYALRYPAHADKCHVIENGYDEEAFAQTVPDREGVPADKLLLLHSGLIYPQERDPATFFQAVRSLIDEGVLQAGALCIRFRAPHHNAEVMASDKEAFNRFFHAMLEAGIYLAPSAFEAGFVSAVHSDADIAATVAAADAIFAGA